MSIASLALVPVCDSIERYLEEGEDLVLGLGGVGGSRKSEKDDDDEFHYDKLNNQKRARWKNDKNRGIPLQNN